MSNPWDVPPYPRRGDSHDDLTYAGVGRVMSQWEAVEYRLARLYSAFVGHPDEFYPTQEYSKPTIFRERYAALGRKANEHFVKHSNQNREGEFHAIGVRLIGFADRRNEVAHGIVLPINGIGFYREKLDQDAQHSPQFALVPPLYLSKKHAPEGYPLFAYTSPYLIDLSLELFRLSDQVYEFDKGLFPRDSLL